MSPVRLFDVAHIHFGYSYLRMKIAEITSGKIPQPCQNFRCENAHRRMNLKNNLTNSIAFRRTTLSFSLCKVMISDWFQESRFPNGHCPNSFLNFLHMNVNSPIILDLNSKIRHCYRQRLQVISWSDILSSSTLWLLVKFLSWHWNQITSLIPQQNQQVISIFFRFSYC